MAEHEKWLADQCFEIIGDKNKGTLEYIMKLAKKSKTINELESGLNDFDIPMDDNPRNKYFAAELFDKFGSRTQV